jgi:hypothetical protein
VHNFLGGKKSLYIKMDVCVCIYIYIYTHTHPHIYIYMSQHNSGTPGAISTKLGTHMAVCIYIYTHIVTHKRSLSRGSSDLPNLWKCGNLACVFHLDFLHMTAPSSEGCLRRGKERGNRNGESKREF